MQKAFEQVKELLANKEISNYRISQATGIAQSTLSDYVKGKTNINRMPIENAIKLHNYYLEEMGEMVNIKQIIAGIENGEIELENLDPNYHEVDYIDGASDHYIVHQVEGHEELDVFFAEHDHVKEVRNDVYKNGRDEIEAFEELTLNEYADQYDYDNVVAYRVDGGEVQWI